MRKPEADDRLPPQKQSYIYGEVACWPLATALVAIGGSALLGIVSWPINVAVAAGALEMLFAMVLFVRLKGLKR